MFDQSGLCLGLLRLTPLPKTFSQVPQVKDDRKCTELCQTNSFLLVNSLTRWRMIFGLGHFYDIYLKLLLCGKNLGAGATEEGDKKEEIDGKLTIR